MAEGKINLGMEDSLGPCCVQGPPMSESKVRYPVIHYSGPEELDLPDEGTARVRFKVIRTVEESRDGKEFYQCELELHWISDVKEAGEGGGPMFKSSAKDTEDALDSLARKKLSEQEDEEDEEDEED